MQGTPISLPLPLNDFAKAYDGPPTDPKVFEEQQRKLQEELQKQAEEARKKLEAQQPTAQAPAAPRKRNNSAIIAAMNAKGAASAAPFLFSGHSGTRFARTRWRAPRNDKGVNSTGCGAGDRRRCRPARTLR